MGFEWCCTCGVNEDPDGGVQLLRVLDWRPPGVGRTVIVAWQRGPAGEFANITWPGFVGVATAMAPGRFAVALNQAPMLSRGLSWPGDWLAGRIGVWRSRALPPTHLLRQVFEQCETYEDAYEVLSRTPLCLPAFFTLAGVEPGQGCVIERTETEVAHRTVPTAVANHWVGLAQRGRPRGIASHKRQALMEAALRDEIESWVVAPIINRYTRVVATMNPARGRMIVQGWEREAPATAELVVQNS
jgi:hypothetical protein